MEKMYTKKAKGYEVEGPVEYRVWMLGTIGAMFVNQTLCHNPFLMFAVNMGLSGLLLTELVADEEYKVLFSNMSAIRYNFDKNYIPETEVFADYLIGCKLTSANAYVMLYRVISEMQRSGYSDERIAEYLVETMYENKDNKKGPKELKLSNKKF